MCGIAGFSLSKDSKINVRELSNALLIAIEDRGYMASGYAWQTNNKMGVYKDAVPGSYLPLKSMPKESRNVILHTRLATHGTTSDNRNNHPVMSPSNDIALVHNGVIYNHTSVRRKVTGDLPPVDTSVIPAVIEQHGVSSLDLLDGDAAIAWFNRAEPNTMHLARYQHSPLVVAQVEDGSFIFCSTESLLWQALIKLDLAPEWMYSPKELDYMTIRNGVIDSLERLPAPKYDTEYDYGYYRHQTSGAKGSGVTTIGTPKGSTARSVYSSLDDWDDDEYDAYYPTSLSCAIDKDDMYDDEYTRAVIEDTVETPAFYTTILEKGLGTDTFTYPTYDEKAWKDELYMLANESNVELIDYGYIEDNNYVSIMYDEDKVF